MGADSLWSSSRFDVGPILFKIVLNDLFLTLNNTDIAVVMPMAIPFINM